MMIMKKSLRPLALAGLLVLALASCTKDEPKTTPPTPTPPPVVPPTPPKPTAQFDKSQVEVSLFRSVSATLIGFKGALTLEEAIEGFEVAIKENVVTIRAEKYVPGEYTFTFKGDATSYKLQVTLARIPEPKESPTTGGGYGIYTEDGEVLMVPKFTNKRFDKGQVSGLLFSSNQDNPRESFIQLSNILIANIEIRGSDVSFTLRSKGIKAEVDGALYLPDGTQEAKGQLIEAPSAPQHRVRIFAMLASGKFVQVYYPAK